jgi:hypothetical protein
MGLIPAAAPNAKKGPTEEGNGKAVTATVVAAAPKNLRLDTGSIIEFRSFMSYTFPGKKVGD